MRIPEFVDNMAKRFDSKLSAPDQVQSFLEDCKIHLKKYEGEVLGYTFHEIVAINKSRTHPTIAKIRKVCSDKMGNDYKDTNPVSAEQEAWQKNHKMATEFKTTESFKWAAQHMIGVDVLLYIERKGEVPDRPAIDRMLRAHQEFKTRLADLDAIREPTQTQMAHWKMGNALNNKNLDYYHAHTD
jgi:hypothetical protein